MKAALPLLTMMLAAGCVTEPPVHEHRVTYVCDRGPPLTVIYAGDTATIAGDAGEIPLQRKPAGSGIRYESVAHSIRGKGNTIIYTVGRMAPMTCTVAE
jgi:membrane-bound inhibitor of C-type lysozyme